MGDKDESNKPTTSKGETAKEKEKKEERSNINERDADVVVKELESEKENEESDENPINALLRFFTTKLHLSSAERASNEKLMADLSLDGLTKHWKVKGFKNIITMVGAGISTSAGIPDFRSPGTGLYDNLQKYNLPYPEAIFAMNYFNENPKPFFVLAKELYPGSFLPTAAHYFVRLLHEKGLLLRHYTQNIDTLERIAGIPPEKLVEAHGTFFTNHCLGCQKLYSMEWMKEQIFADVVPTCERCNHVVKPDIVFFGEDLPKRFYSLPWKDFTKCDLLIIMGTSLEVYPFASLVHQAPDHCLRLLINRTKVDNFMSEDDEENYRDVAFIGDCDDGVYKIADALGWRNDLEKLIEAEHERLAKEQEGRAKQKSDDTDSNTEETVEVQKSK